ncbi:MAG: AMP-binding protein, partial [Treponema sp.]|nr:AMP-binding protein [Treponema sp.]
LYNGGIFYGLIAIFFAVEYMVRRMVKKKLPRAVPLSRVTPAARKKDTVLCYSGSYGGGLYRTWGDFLAETAALRSFIEREKERRWILYGGDYWFFLIAYTALLQCKREVLLTANISPAYMEEIAGDAVLITDEKDALPLVRRSFYIPELLARKEGEARKDRGNSASSPVPPIRADETVIVMYTSGTTGEPKQVVQRLTEFEKDNDFILSQWGGEFLKRKLCSTVGPHHIYGLLFSMMLPFTAGIPFRRERIEFPETFETLKDDSYMIITVPALLKRSVENREVPFGIKDPWIFTSGGVLPFEIAAQTEKLFGFWPLEVYGSTETSGIAWRQSRDGPEWTPFSNAELWKNGEGCLVIKSPYIKDPAGFTTGDLAELLDGGRFLLKGRADSIVKIEEKRISLPEIESRLLRSGLVSDAAAAALQGKRQYLAAALVLNKEGRKRFEGMEKFRINRYFREYLGDFFEPQVIPRKWRYLDALPRDAQGKLQKGEIGALFRDPPGPARSGEEDGAISAADAGAAVAAVPSAVLAFPGGVSGTLLERSQNSGGLSRAVFELSVPGDSPYFDGHFPQFKLLPAVAQIELVLACASFILGPSLISGAKRLKFSGAVFPDTKVLVEIDWALRDSGNTLRYALNGPGGRSCSSGMLCLESAGGPF